MMKGNYQPGMDFEETWNYITANASGAATSWVVSANM